MYTISRFSQLCKMSARMLRHYDKEELLKPVHVDTTNGYRFYEKNQLETALLIKKLKEYRFSLPEIRTILQSSDSTLFIEMIYAKINEISKEMSRYRQIITEMHEMIEKNEDLIQGERKSYDILLGMRKEIRVVSQRLQINIDDMDKYIDSFYDKAKESNIQLLSVPSVIFFDEEFTPDHCDIELMIPIIHRNDEKISREWQIKKLPQKIVATTLHIGSYDYIGYAHMALEEWTESNGYCMDGLPYETYLKGSECDCHVEEYVTQISLPVIKKEMQ
ncbi:MerR family transcriptional regulator [Viridibacillus sp. FSL R5-0477]|uniref:MerR family transcriptional regulator n=1 Tax=Viridibacillus arenosi FSL R5-213 TaxID=1227360 RepID=W4F2R9_9BACL|nr:MULTISPECIES: MerR family transcriptional regulator [Viridibacillus]ETT86592.1 MerR family transcriptional regulator [Viridibacillus arenosi FSL R5-213]OMC83586.1 MerR family transcriptional regulator [Viridibacillus sp. FSL H8-0123]OMC85954.1 MerR family transcriptional regulator [Viridibacillus sp. FSL H7-0596]OMC88067.1 MerR family transcriptional regulator [Viridibacillus arenosi]